MAQLVADTTHLTAPTKHKNHDEGRGLDRTRGPHVAKYDRKDRMEPSAAENLVVVLSKAEYAPPFTRKAVTTSLNTYRKPTSIMLTNNNVTGASCPAWRRESSG